MPYFYFLILLIVINSSLQAQDLSSHKWEHRILLLFANAKNQAILQEQLAMLNQEKERLMDRKLVIYQIFPDVYTTQKAPKGLSTLYEQYMDSDSDFKVVLIGLDGTVKREKTTAITTDELFALIDAMPMRRTEMKRATRDQRP